MSPGRGDRTTPNGNVGWGDVAGTDVIGHGESSDAGIPDEGREKYKSTNRSDADFSHGIGVHRVQAVGPWPDRTPFLPQRHRATSPVRGCRRSRRRPRRIHCRDPRRGTVRRTERR